MISQYQTRITQALAQIQEKLEQGAIAKHDAALDTPPETSADIVQMEQTLSELQRENAELRETVAHLTQERAQEAQELEALYAKLADALNKTPQQEDE